MINTPSKRNALNREVSRRLVLSKLNSSGRAGASSLHKYKKGGMKKTKKGGVERIHGESVLSLMKNKASKHYRKPVSQITDAEAIKYAHDFIHNNIVAMVDLDNFNKDQYDPGYTSLGKVFDDMKKYSFVPKKYRSNIAQRFGITGKNAQAEIGTLLYLTGLVTQPLTYEVSKKNKQLQEKEKMGKPIRQAERVLPNEEDEEDEFYEPELIPEKPKINKKEKKYYEPPEEDEDIEQKYFNERLALLADPNEIGQIVVHPKRSGPSVPRLKKGEYEKLYRPSSRREIIPPQELQAMERAIVPSDLHERYYPEYAKSSLNRAYGDLDVDDYYYDEPEQEYPYELDLSGYEDILGEFTPKKKKSKYEYDEELDYSKPVDIYDINYLEAMRPRREMDFMDYLASIEGDIRYPVPVRGIPPRREEPVPDLPPIVRPLPSGFDLRAATVPIVRAPAEYELRGDYPIFPPDPVDVEDVEEVGDVEEVRPPLGYEEHDIIERPVVADPGEGYDFLDHLFGPDGDDGSSEEESDDEPDDGGEPPRRPPPGFVGYEVDPADYADRAPPPGFVGYEVDPADYADRAPPPRDTEAELVAEVEREIKKGLMKKEIKAKLKDPKSFAAYYDKIVAKIRKRMAKEEKERAVEFYKTMRGPSDVSSQVKDILNANFAKYMRDRGITDPNMIQGPISGGNSRYIDKSRQQEYYRKYQKPVYASAYGNLLNKNYYNPITKTIGDCHNYSNFYNYYGGASGVTGNVLHLRDVDYPKYILKVKDTLSIDPKNTAIIGSRSYDELAIYPSDLDLLEFIVDTTEVSTINTFINGIRKIVERVVSDKDYWFDHVKLGVDNRYPDPNKIGKFDGKFVPSKELISRINYLYSLNMLSDEDYDFLTQKKPYNLIGYDMYRDIIKKYRTLRWTANDINNGFIELIDGENLTIYNACKENAPINIEVTTIAPSDIIRVSNFFVLGYKNNGTIHGINTDDAAAKSDIEFTVRNLKKSIEELYFSSEFNPLKMIKRINSFIAIKGNVKKDLGDVIKLLYKSPGFMYYAKTKMETIRDLYKMGVRFPYELAVNELIYIEEMIGRSEISNFGKDYIYKLINELIDVFNKPKYSNDNVAIKLLDELYNIFDMYTYNTLNTLEKERFKNFDPPLDRYLPDKKDRLYLVNDKVNRLKRYHELEKKYKQLL